MRVSSCHALPLACLFPVLLVSLAVSAWIIRVAIRRNLLMALRAAADAGAVAFDGARPEAPAGISGAQPAATRTGGNSTNRWRQFAWWCWRGWRSFEAATVLSR